MTIEELEQIARSITTTLQHAHPATNLYGAMERLIVAELARVQDEALNARLPSHPAIGGGSREYYENFLKDAPMFENARTRWMREDFEAGALWLRANMKSAKDRCPCGGVILADTEDFRVPLCNECYEQVLSSVKSAPETDNNLSKNTQKCIEQYPLGTAQIEEMPITKLKPEVKATPWQHACELCGSPVKIVGETTQHYEPVESIQRHTMQMPSWEALKEYMREIGSSKFNDPSIELAYQWIKAKMTGFKSQMTGEK